MPLPFSADGMRLLSFWESVRQRTAMYLGGPVAQPGAFLQGILCLCFHMDPLDRVRIAGPADGPRQLDLEGLPAEALFQRRKDRPLVSTFFDGHAGCQAAKDSEAGRAFCDRMDIAIPSALSRRFELQLRRGAHRWRELREAGAPIASGEEGVELDHDGIRVSWEIDPRWLTPEEGAQEQALDALRAGWTCPLAIQVLAG